MGGFYVNQGKLRFKVCLPCLVLWSSILLYLKVGDESEEVNLITGTKKRNLGLKRLDEEDEEDDDDNNKADVNTNSSPIKNNKIENNSGDKVKAATHSVAQKIVAKAKKTQKVVATKPKPQGLTNGNNTAKGTNGTSKTTDTTKRPVSPGRSSQRSPRSPARLIHEKQDIRVTQTLQTTPDENDHLPPEIPTPLREKCENLRKIAELQKGLSSQKFFSPSINQMLLEIEEIQMQLQIPQKIRSKIIDYLAKVTTFTSDALEGLQLRQYTCIYGR